MTERLPVGETLNEAFQFGSKRLLTIIRLGWLPMVLTYAMAVGFARLVFAAPTPEALRDGSAQGAYLTVPPAFAVLLGVGVIIVVMLLMSGFMASVYRLVALGEDRDGVFNIRFDGPSIRVFWAQLIVALIGFGIFVIAFLVALMVSGSAPGEVLSGITRLFAAAMSAAETGGQPDEQLVMEFAKPASVFMLAGLFALLPSLYVNVRLAAFASGSAAENRLFLLGAFNLSKGHFWSIFGVYFFLVLALIVLAFIYMILSSILELLASLGGGGGALAVIGFVFGALEIAALILYQAFVLGVQLSVKAIFYRRLKTGA